MIVSGRFGKSMPWGKSLIGSVVGQIVVDEELVFSRDVDDGGGNYEVSIEAGTTVDFLIGPKDAIGVIDFTGTLRRDFPAKPAADPGAAVEPEIDEL